MNEDNIPKRKSSTRNAALQTVCCFYLVMLGIGFCTMTLLEVKLFGIPLLLVIGLVSVIFLVGSFSKSLSWYMGLATIVGTAAVMWIGKESLIAGGKNCANTLILKINNYYSMEMLLWYVDKTMKQKTAFFLLLLFFLGLLEGICWYGVKGRCQKIARLLLPIGLVTLGLLLGHAPSFYGICFMLTGILFMEGWVIEKGHGVLTGIMAGVLVCFMVFANSGVTEQILLKYHDTWIHAQHKMENEAWKFAEAHLDFSSLAAELPLTQMTLSNRRPNQTGKKIFHITMSERPKDTVYVKGFVGEIYENGTWEAVNKQDFSDLAQSVGYSNEEYAKMIQQFPYQSFHVFDHSPVNIVMEFNQRIPGYTLLPYYTSMTDGMIMEADGGIEPGKEKLYQLSGYATIPSDLSKTFSMEPSLNIIVNANLKKKVKWDVYQNYVKQRDTMVPNQNMENLRLVAEELEEQLFTPNGNLFLQVKEEASYSLWESLVQHRLWEDTSYSLDLQKLPPEKEFSSYFLLEQKKGYCVHYATTGTLLLRMLGIPARYVSGYLIPSTDFKKNEKGTYTAVVTDKQAHAWTEVFQEELGFYPVEMTPPIYNRGQTENKKENNEKEPLLPPEEQIKEQQEEADKKVEEDKSTSQHIETDNSPSLDTKEPVTMNLKPKTPILQLWIVVFSMLLLGILIILLLILRRNHVLKFKKHQFEQLDYNKAILALGSEIYRILKEEHLAKPKELEETEYGIWLEKKLPFNQGLSWTEFIAQMQQATFSQDSMEKAQWQDMVLLYEQMKYHLFMGKKKRVILYLKYFKNFS